MQDRRAGTAIVRTVGVLVGIVTVVGLIFAVNADMGFEGCTGTARFGWLAPLIAASVIGGVAWLLLSQESHHDDDERPTSALASCPECGRVVLSQWRMCPYCGEMLDVATPASPATSDS